MLATILLLGLLTVAAVTDVRWHKIYNWTTYSGMLVAVLLYVGGSILLLQADVTVGQLKSWGWITPGDSLAGLLSLGFLVLVCFVIFSNIGGGDVKLMAMVGAFTGPLGVLFTLFAASIVGAFVGVALIPLRGRSLSDKLPFGCFLAPAAVVAMLYGRQAIGVYFDLVLGRV